MAVVAFAAHPDRPQALALAEEAVAWLLERDHEVRLPAEDAASLGRPELGRETPELLPGLDLAVSFGGDGTMLRAVDLFSPAGTPVLGINVGQLGFLTEVEPDGMRMALKRFLSGAYDVEERMMLSVSTAGIASGDGEPATALNEVVIEKTPMGHTVRLGVDIDGVRFTTYQADGLIVASPTGSTAYSMSARGPIVTPTHRALIVTAVSPHMLFDRSLVLEPESCVRVTVEDDRAATVSVDGRNLGQLPEGGVVECSAAERSARIVTFRPRDFHQILRTKFGLPER
ncbi:MAG TPA: NAD(+)/NADH kinase [Acidimicrobiales bacterium]|jgi:NAD+ kinase